MYFKKEYYNELEDSIPIPDPVLYSYIESKELYKFTLLSRNHQKHAHNIFEHLKVFTHPWSNTIFRYNSCNNKIELLRDENIKDGLLNAKTIQIEVNEINEFGENKRVTNLYAVLSKDDLRVFKYEKSL